MNWTELSFFHERKLQEVLSAIVAQRLEGKKIFPPQDDMFNALALTSFDETKVVILGQDPYPTKGHANGLAFSVNPGVPLPRSLKNIFKELQSDTNEYRSNGDLTDWATQGVLLLNTSLSVVEGKPGSHSDIGWAALTQQIIRELNEKKENVVFILWGKHAREKGASIDRNKHCVIESAHPSPLSVREFYGSKPFSKANAYLTQHNLKPIKWSRENEHQVIDNK
jgi:uracil-DNA glycosylase